MHFFMFGGPIVASWFDNAAKRSSQRAEIHTSGSTRNGLSRRQLIKGGSAAVAVGWTAPMLMSSPAYAYGVSGCTTGNICGASNELQACCPVGYLCTRTVAANGVVTNGCAAPGTAGGTCTNQGQGTSGCTAGGSQSTHCNGNNGQCGCTKPNVCGGFNAQCDSTADCAPGYVCNGTGNAKFCKPSCATTPCPTNVSSAPLTCNASKVCV
jgi:hypothetical protein